MRCRKPHGNNRIEFQIEQNGTGFLSNASWTTLDTSAVSGAPSSTVSKKWVFSQPTGTTDSYSLQARIAFGSGGPVNAISRLIQVIYVPFGSAGTSSLGDMSSLAGGPPAVDDTP